MSQFDSIRPLFRSWARAAVPGSAPLVLLNSLGCSHVIWDGVVRRLPAECGVLVSDYRGHGGSGFDGPPYGFDDLVDDCLRLLDQEGVDRAHVAGISIGGMAALRLAARSPERVASAVAMCCGGRLDEAAWRERARFVRANGVGALIDVVVPRWFTEATRLDRPSLVHAAAADLLSCDDEGYACLADGLAEADLEPDLAVLTRPATIVSAEFDIATPPSQQRRLADATASARLVTVPGAAHLATLELPEKVAEILVGHLKWAGAFDV
ncbi:MAG: alpha/beta fold hydrolase [Bifidobacteriaceae bacterium]|jgi:3-oxoadipate enol-lactonase|nr:alpha/beta fold hydrolase [Bifidobacteriaceae bacterium]